MTENNTVQSVADVPDGSMLCRFVKIANPTGKMPHFRYYVHLTKPLDGIMLVGTIFQDGRSGQYTVSLPGGRNFGGVVNAEPQSFQDASGNVRYLGTDHPSDVGAAKLSRWESQVLTALYAFQKTGTENQTISL